MPPSPPCIILPCPVHFPAKYCIFFVCLVCLFVSLINEHCPRSPSKCPENFPNFLNLIEWPQVLLYCDTHLQTRWLMQVDSCSAPSLVFRNINFCNGERTRDERFVSFQKCCWSRWKQFFIMSMDQVERTWFIIVDGTAVDKYLDIIQWHWYDVSPW